MIRSRGCSAGAGRGIRPSYLLARNGCAALIIIIDTAPHSEGAALVAIRAADLVSASDPRPAPLAQASTW